MKNILLWLRSILFLIVFYAITLVMSLLFIPTFLLPRKYALWFPICWTWILPRLLRFFCGVKVVFKGLENLPKENGYMIACKHQSALETLLFHAIVPNTFYVLKRELLFIPIAGLYAPKTGCVAIDRKGGASAMRKMLNKVQKNLEKGMNLIIFPEGTRVKPGEKKTYNPGVALLYEQCKAPVVPVALNTGYCWPKNQTKKIPGTVTIEFLPPMPAGLHRRAFLSELQDRIEEATDKLPNPFNKETK
ncbi:MAG: 1-acyl-sn-glycerol-3-phosphate acyltransferase [Alphaproteobacteria bacterium]|nr:1-acyl-sn-glycerol-3-phosphate acyltransferase [Alphaproteobacteria bacterium]